jgi:hypothetical protein
MAVVVVTTTMAGAINYTHVTDTSADWPSVPNSTYFYDKADKLVHYKDGTGTILEVFSAGGLTYFTEAQNTTAPNATVPVDSLTAVAGTTDADIAIVPKGAGAFTLAVADNTATGGNKRGTNAIDLQTLRVFGTSVASGASSVAIGVDNRAAGIGSVAIGRGARADGQDAVAIGPGAQATISNCFSFGNGSVASGGFGAVALGRGNTSSGDGTLTAGFANTASGSRAIAIGESNTASANGAVALGVGVGASGAGSFASGWVSNTFGIRARKSHGNNNTVSGDCQKSEFPLSKRTTDATATTLTVAGGVASTANQVILSNNSAYAFEGKIIGKQSGSTNAAVWKVEGLIVRGANAASTVLTASTVTLFSNLPGWGTPTLAADTTNGGLQVQVSGLAATNIQWTAVIETTEVIYA